MANKLNPQACFLVSRDKLYFFSNERGEVLELPFSSEIMQDLEIVSPASLERVLKNWLDQTKIVPKQAVLMLDNSICFQRKLSAVPSNVDEELQKFLEVVPFTEVSQKIFPMEGGAYIVAINQNLLQPLVSTLEKLGFIIINISPAFLFNVDASQTTFNKGVAQQIMANVELLLNFSFLTSAELEAKIVEPKPFLTVKFDKKLISLIVVFIILIGVLLILLKMR